MVRNYSGKKKVFFFLNFKDTLNFELHCECKLGTVRSLCNAEAVLVAASHPFISAGAAVGMGILALKGECLHSSATMESPSILTAITLPTEVGFTRV